MKFENSNGVNYILNMYEILIFRYFVKGLSHALKAATSLSSRSGHPLTIVVPTDKAFKELPEGKLQQYATDRKFMNKVFF